MKYLATDATADDPDYAVTDGTQTEILEECTADISPNSPEHELNNQSHIHIAPPLILPCLTAETTCRVPARSKLAPHHHSNAPPESPDHYFKIAAVPSAGCIGTLPLLATPRLIATLATRLSTMPCDARWTGRTCYLLSSKSSLRASFSQSEEESAFARNY